MSRDQTKIQSTLNPKCGKATKPFERTVLDFKGSLLLKS